MFCQKFDKERKELKQNLKVEDLSIKIILKPQNAQHLISYVKSTQMYYVFVIE